MTNENIREFCHTYTPGIYMVDYWSKIDRLEDNVPVCTIAINLGSKERKRHREEKIIMSGDFKADNTYQSFCLKVNLYNIEKLEFELLSSGLINFWMDRLEIVRES